MVEFVVRGPELAELHVALLAVGPYFGNRDLEVGVLRGRLHIDVEARRSGDDEILERVGHVADTVSVGDGLPHVGRRRGPWIALGQTRRGAGFRVGGVRVFAVLCRLRGRERAVRAQVERGREPCSWAARCRSPFPIRVASRRDRGRRHRCPSARARVDPCGTQPAPFARSVSPAERLRERRSRGVAAICSYSVLLSAMTDGGMVGGSSAMYKPRNSAQRVRSCPDRGDRRACRSSA